jgi:hypothetical protein
MIEENYAQRDSPHHRLFTEERALRQQVVRGCSNSLLGNVLINGYSAILVFLYYLISLESLFSIALSVGLTVCK